MHVLARRHLLRLALAVACASAAMTALTSSARGDSVQASCNSAYCYWGYNYVFPNRIVYTPVSNFYSASDNINSGGRSGSDSAMDRVAVGRR
jgi:hypothetical protein